VSAKTSKPAALRPLKLPPHEQHVLANGLTTHLVSRGPLPLVAVRLVIRGGSAFDPKGKQGLADFTARLLRRGAGGRSADDLSEAIDFVAAAMGGYANEENVVLSLSVPSKHLESMLELMSLVLLRPDFPQAELDLARRRTLAQLKNELDDPGALAERALMGAVWGTHPYGHETVGTRADLESLTRDDLVRFHREQLGPRVSNLFLVGDVEPRRTLKLVERFFGGWSGGPSAPPSLPEWSGPARAGEVLIVNKPEQTQVQVRIAAKGVKRGHPMHFPIAVMNGVLGGGFTSRLVTEIRVKRGLSYGAGSSYDMLSAAGTFSVSSFTRTETVNTLIDVALAEVARMRKHGPLAREVETVQRYISGLYPGRLETNEAIAGAIADVQHYGLPSDWISRFRERVVAVTLKEAAQAAREHLFDEQKTIVLVGNAEALARKVKVYGKVSVIEPAALE
jgi:zinc protease